MGTEHGSSDRLRSKAGEYLASGLSVLPAHRAEKRAADATVAASNPQQTRFFESLVNSPEEGEAFLTVYGDRGLPTQCGLGYTAWRQINGEYRITGITEFTEWGFPFGALCRCGFSKLTEDA